MLNKLKDMINPNMDNIYEYLCKDLCEKCGGACCKGMGCTLAPEQIKGLSIQNDLEENTEILKKVIETQLVSIDWWQSDTEDYFLRIRNICSDIVDPSWGGVCMLHTRKGYLLEDEFRPKQGIQLKCYIDKRLGFILPMEGGYSKYDASIDWAKYPIDWKSLIEYSTQICSDKTRTKAYRNLVDYEANRSNISAVEAKEKISKFDVDDMLDLITIWHDNTHENFNLDDYVKDDHQCHIINMMSIDAHYNDLMMMYAESRLDKGFNNQLKDQYLTSTDYPIITLCGSSRFKNEFREIEKELTLKGNIVLSLNIFSHSDNNTNLDKSTIKMLHELHLKKIRLANKIVVINKDGYIGESTKKEISYAESIGIPVEYYWS